MQWFYNLKIFNKLALSFTAVLSLTIVLGVFSLVQMDRINAVSTEIDINWMPSVRFASGMNTDIASYRSAELQYILSVDAKDRDKYLREMDRILAVFETNRSDYKRVISSPEEQKLYDAFSKNWDEYLDEHKKVLALSLASRDTEAAAMIRGSSQQQYDEAAEDLSKLVKLNIAGGSASSAAGDQLYERARLYVILVMAGAVALGLGCAMVVARAVSTPLVHAVEVVQTVAGGDLTGKIEFTSLDETGQLLCALREMKRSLSSMVGQVRSGTEVIVAASSQIASGNLDLSARTEQQASSLEETASSMEQMTSAVKHNADHALHANQLAISASQVASQGGAVMAQVVETMSLIDRSSRKIADIIGVIDDIAFQTNILALNAAVEAARAGEQGRGFAVVAGEVRNLAQRSAAAAKEIKGLINDSVDKVALGAMLVEKAGSTMANIVTSIGSVTDIMEEITVAGQQQTSGIEQINQAVGQMDEVTQQNASLVEEAAAAAQSLRDQADSLSRVVGVFKVSGAGLALTLAPRPR